jgi:hypothetical protein
MKIKILLCLFAAAALVSGCAKHDAAGTPASPAAATSAPAAVKLETNASDATCKQRQKTFEDIYAQATRTRPNHPKGSYDKSAAIALAHLQEDYKGVICNGVTTMDLYSSISRVLF